MKHRKIKDITKNSILHIVILLLIVSGIFLYYNKIGIFILFIMLSIIVFFMNSFENFKREKKFVSYIENISDSMNNFNEMLIQNLEIPLIIIEEDGTIIWYNKYISDLVQKEIIDLKVYDVFVGFNINSIKEIKISDRFYNVKILNCNMDKIYETLKKTEENDKILKSKTFLSFEKNKEIKNLKSQKLVMFFDITREKKLTEAFDDKKMSVIYLQIDNFDDIVTEIRDDKRIFVISEIEKKVMLFATRINAIISKYEKDKYLMVLENRHLQNIITNKFSILEDIKDIEFLSNVYPTISIGASSLGSTPAKVEENAFNALEMALGRGGDQAVLKVENDYEFYGGRSKGTEKTNKVKSRVVAHAFKNILDNTRNVYIMGHQYPDMDAIGASIGVYRICMNRGKNAHIILKESNESIKLIYDKFKDDAKYKFVSHDYVNENFDREKDLLVVVDTHKPSFTEYPKVIEMADRIVLFDHHRRGKEYIDNTLLTYLEPYASSTCELISEVIQYMEKKVILEKKEAEALLAGMIVDTKNFSQQTGVRTFQAAAFLRRFDADTVDVRQLFQDDLQTFVNKAELVKNAKVYKNNVAISINEQPIENPRLIASQAADQLLNIIGILCSFVIVCDETRIYVSGRSIGDISVQIMLENIGGGGHLNASAAQFSKEEFTITQVENILKNSIESYFNTDKHSQKES